MRLTFTGAAQTVTGSRHLITLNGTSFLLECGLYQGRREETYTRNLNFPFNPKDIRTVVLSHAHIDHCGNLPNLVRQGFTGKIHATAATAQLADITLRDSGHIQEADIEYLAKKQARHGRPPPPKPLYTIADAEQATRLLASQDYDRPFQPAPGVTATFVEAGHILGSAGILLELEENGRNVRLMFSGDIGRPGMPILRDPVLPADVDYLLMECTYGDTPHDPPEKAYEAFRSAVRRTVDRGGKLIIPSFAIGRTQLLVYELHEMIDRRELPRIPVYVDSPLAVNATEIFKDHPEIFDQQTQEFIRTDSHRQALGFDLLTYTQSVEESKAINGLKGPLVIISASGMAETGRILHHLRNNIEDPKNMILITSWMAPDTLGRRLADGQKRVRIFGEEFPVQAEVVKIDGFSAHAGQDFLVTYARAVRGRAKRIFLVHGEAGPAQALKGRLSDLGIPIDYPALGSQVEL